MIKLKGSTTTLLLQLRDEIKTYSFADYEEVVYGCVLFLARGFSVPVQIRIVEYLLNKFNRSK